MAKETLLGYLIAYAEETSVIERDRLFQKLRDKYFKGVKIISYKCTVEHTVLVDGHAKDIKRVIMGTLITNVSHIDIEQQIEAEILTKWKIIKFGNDLKYEIKQL